MKHINVEIKAKCDNHEQVRNILQSHKADFKGIDHQIDTYFNVRDGRLKLREGGVENFLIFYQRSDQEGPKQSDVILFASEPDSSLKDILLASLGALVVVDKHREIYFIDNVKFHLDTVEGLGTFIEIEAIDMNGNISKERLTHQCDKYLQLLNVSPDDLISVSYSDMVLDGK